MKENFDSCTPGIKWSGAMQPCACFSRMLTPTCARDKSGRAASRCALANPSAVFGSRERCVCHIYTDSLSSHVLEAHLGRLAQVCSVPRRTMLLAEQRGPGLSRLASHGSALRPCCPRHVRERERGTISRYCIAMTTTLYY